MSRVRDRSHRIARLRTGAAHIWLSGALVAMLLRQAGADVITTYTPPLRNAEQDEISCVALNHTNQDVQVSAVLRNESGDDLGGNATTVGPGELEPLVFNSASVGAAYCRFIFDGDNGNTRLIAAAHEVRGVARPTVTYSPPVLSGPTHLVSCIAQNVGGAGVEVTGRMRNGVGVVLQEMTSIVEAGDVSGIVGATDPLGATYCEFEFNGNPSAVRGYVSLSGHMGENTRFIAAASESLPVAGSTLLSRAIAPDGGVVHCIAQNLDSEAVFVDADLLDQDGIPIETSSGTELQPGEVALLTNSSVASVEPVSCRFDLDTPDSRVRAFVAFLEPAGAGLRLLEEATSPSGTAGLGAISFTPPLRNFVEDNNLECWLHNLTAAPLAINAALVDEDGSPLDSREVLVGAGLVRRVVHSNEETFGAHCRFTFNGSPAAIRGHIVLNDGSPRLLYTASLASALTPFPTPTASATLTPSVTPNPSATPSATLTPTSSPSNTPTPSPTSSPSHTATSTPSAAHTATSTTTPNTPHTATATHDAASTPTSTANATSAATATPDGTANPSPSQSPPDATATASSTGTPAMAAPGDANCDGVVSAADLVAVVAAIASDAEPVCGEDANQDGDVDAADLDQVAALIFGTE